VRRYPLAADHVGSLAGGLQVVQSKDTISAIEIVYGRAWP
jgi:hypothetical protein